MLTGSMPFKGESPLAVLRQILDEEPPSLLQIDPDLDPRIARVVERMVAKEPNDRYQTCHQLVADLDEILATHAAVAPTAGVVARRGASSVAWRRGRPTSARTQAKVTGRPEDAPTQAALPSPPPPDRRITSRALRRQRSWRRRRSNRWPRPLRRRRRPRRRPWSPLPPPSPARAAVGS